MKKFLILALMLIAGIGHTQQGPSIRLDGDLPQYGIPVGNEPRSLIDSGVTISNGTMQVSNLVVTGTAIVPGAGSSKTVPYFDIDLIYFDPSTGDFVKGSEIEVKCSEINDFTGSFKYWGDTMGDLLSSYPNFDGADYNATVYYPDYTNTDTRFALKFTTDPLDGVTLTDALTISGPVCVTHVLFYPSATNHLGQPYNWSESDTNLTWRINIRSPVLTGPKNPTGRTLWSIRRPQWDTSRPK